MDSTTGAAFQAISRGFQAIPLIPRDKKPPVAGWTHIKWEEGTTQEQVNERFTGWGYPQDALGNVGVLLGEPSGNLLDVDLDHYRTSRLKDHFLPPTPARGGRAGKLNSHYWYIAEEGTLPGTRQHLMPRTEDGKRGAVIVELRSTGAQTVIPPSIHPSGESYEWTREPWGGEDGPAVINGRKLAVQVALLALGTVLLDNWPTSGTRHEAYLALAGGLLRDGEGVHTFWGDQGGRNAATLIRALATATNDDDGPDAREAESIQSTIKNLKAGNPVAGFGKLAEIIGQRYVDQVRVLVGEVESAAGITSRQAPALPSVSIEEEVRQRDTELDMKDSEDRDPLEERLGTWEAVDLDPYLTGRVKQVEPSVMQREDGPFLMYPGRVNMLYGSSESAKSWIALHTCLQVMTSGQRAMFLDMEDEPVNTLSRLQALGARPDDLRFLFTYIRPEEPIAPMQRNRWGQDNVTAEGTRNWELFSRAVDQADPELIVVDGMTVLYGLHGLDSNDAVSTDIITGWLKRLTRNGRTTVIIIDHTSKGAEKGSTPIGSQHKQAMVQGSMLQVWPITQPMPGSLGEVELVVLKDRIGVVRSISEKTGQKAQTAARVVIDSTTPGVTSIRILEPRKATMTANTAEVDLRLSKEAMKAERAREEEEKVKHVYGGELGKELTMRQILLALGYTWEGYDSAEKPSAPPPPLVKTWQRVVDRLVYDGWLRSEGNTRSRTYVLDIGGAGYDIDIDLSNVPD